jgi:excisionase family DNA binding protein
MTTSPPPHRSRTGDTPPQVPLSIPPPADTPEPARSAERLAYSVDEAASLTGLSRDLLYDEMHRGNLRYLKVGRRRLITRQHFEEFLGISQHPTHPAVGALRVAKQQSISHTACRSIATVRDSSRAFGLLTP